jgi:enamine deaminase RidA (YjgF/YER057c/UK114 family)
MSISERLTKLNIIIPTAPEPVGSYVAFKVIKNIVYISGQLPIKENGEIIKGKIGKDFNIEEGKKAAHYCCINILAQLKKACSGDLEKVQNCIKITGYVNSTNDFVEQPKIINSASDMISQIFEHKGKHARAAVSVNSLPLGAAVEIDAIFEISQ